MKENNVKLANYGSEQLIKDAGNLSFFTPLGTTDDVDVFKAHHNSTGTDNISTYGAGASVPGILVVDYDLVPGDSTSGNSALNIAAKKLYTFVRHMNSGSRNYDSPDLMNFAFSAVSLFSFMTQVKRVYGVINKYSAKNRYLGEELCSALGFDYSNLIHNIGDFRAWLNVQIKKLNAIKVPANWPLWPKNFAMNTVLLKDGVIDRSQIYAFRDCVIWEYNQSGTYVGNLTPIFPFGANSLTKLTFTTLRNIVEPIIDAFVASEDINIMSGDIVKAYGEDHCMELDVVADDYTIEPMYNKELLNIMHNTTVYSIKRTVADYQIKQDVNFNCLIFNPEITSLTHSENIGGSVVRFEPTDNEYLDANQDEIKPEDVVSMSIMTTRPTYDSTNSKWLFDSFGTELAHRITVYEIENRIEANMGHGHEVTGFTRYTYCGTIGSAISPTQAALILRFAMISQFDWAPRLTILMPNTSSWAPTNESQTYIGKMYDLYNYTIVSKSDLRKLHDLHVLGGFGLAE